jgi:hypothetical protein
VRSSARWTLVDQLNSIPNVAIGGRFLLTHFDSPKRTISPYIDQSYLAMSPRHAVLQMMTVSGSVWMLENVDR